MDGLTRYGTVIGFGLGASVLALWVGVPLGTILFIGVLLLCPLMMMGMHGGGHGGHGWPPGTETDPDERHRSADPHAR